jgi:hypothetical protein
MDSVGQVDNEEARRRVQLDFSTEAYERLIQLRTKSEAKTNAEVVRNALRLYDWFLDQKRSGYKIQVTDGEVTREIELVF